MTERRRPSPDRRTLLKLLGGGAAALAFGRPLWAAAAAAQTSDEYFIFVHASGGWDVTLWSDPRNERKGIVEPASTDNTDLGPLTHWKSTKLDGDTDTFEILAPSDVAAALRSRASARSTTCATGSPS